AGDLRGVRQRGPGGVGNARVGGLGGITCKQVYPRRVADLLVNGYRRHLGDRKWPLHLWRTFCDTSATSFLPKETTLRATVSCSSSSSLTGTKVPLRHCCSAMDRWSSAFAGRYSAIPTMPRTPSRPRSWCWRARQHPFASTTPSPDGCTGWRSTL